MEYRVLTVWLHTYILCFYILLQCIFLEPKNEIRFMEEINNKIFIQDLGEFFLV